MTPLVAATGLWIAIGVLGALLIAWAAGAFLLLAMGRLTLDLGGDGAFTRSARSRSDRRPARPRVRDHHRPYSGRTRSGSGIDVLARSDELVVAAHHTKVTTPLAPSRSSSSNRPTGWGSGTSPGPCPTPSSGSSSTSPAAGPSSATREVGIDFFVLGRLAARHWVRPQWERAVREHLEDVKGSAEQRAAAHRAGAREP